MKRSGIFGMISDYSSSAFRESPDGERFLLLANKSKNRISNTPVTVDNGVELNYDFGVLAHVQGIGGWSFGSYGDVFMAGCSYWNNYVGNKE